MNGLKKRGKWKYMKEVQRARRESKREQTELQNICTAAVLQKKTFKCSNMYYRQAVLLLKWIDALKELPKM